MIAIRKQIPAGERAAASRVITQKVLLLPEWQKARRVCLYKSFPSEVDTKALFVAARKQKKIIVLPTADAKADLYIVPGVAFDTKGNRLGRGRGFYDRLLMNKKIKIGLAFWVQVVDKVPHSSYDVPMTALVTEK